VCGITARPTIGSNYQLKKSLIKKKKKELIDRLFASIDDYGMSASDHNQ
jgi:hypothetical protein